MLQKLPQVYIETLPATLKSLKDIERQGNSAKTYDELRKLIGLAKAIKIMHSELTQIRQEAEWTIISLRHTLGTRIEEVQKGNAKRRIITDDNSLKRGDLPFKTATRARLLKLVKIKKAKLRKLCEDLWATEHDATLEAIFGLTKVADFKTARADRESVLADKIKALPNKKYGVILADPEWRFKTYSEKGKVRTSAEKHYPTSDLSTIKRRKPPAARDCVLFLWATAPMLPQALEVIDAWGFNYVSNYVWDKMKPGRKGTGYWAINHHEHLLVATRGKPVAPAMGTQRSSIIREKFTKQHSRKPVQSYEMIEAYYPNTPKLEMNLRGEARPGWDGWGNEAAGAQ